MQSLQNKLEAAAKLLMDAEAVSVPVWRNGETVETQLTVLTGIGQEDKALPSATVAAVTGQEFPQGSGNFTLNVTVAITSNADETDLVAHRQACEDALAPLMRDDTESQLNAQEQSIGVLGISNRQCSERVEDRSWVTELQFDCYCCGTALVE
jgi:hypothetical protein